MMLKTKNKLFAAAAMLMVSVILLSTASFAWFTISTNPEITSMTTQVVTNENLEIALSNDNEAAPGASATGDTGNQYKWGNIIDLSADGTAKTAYDALDKTLRPATLSTTFQAPTYGTDGRPSTLSGLTVGTMANGFGTMTGANDKVYGYYVDFWLQSNKGGQVSLSTATKRSSDGADGGGSKFTSTNQVLADNVGIAFQPGATGGITAATMAAPSGTETYTTAISGSVCTLTANTPQLVRMYVYLEGTNVTNESASLADVINSGSLNIQFDLAGLGNSMDYTAPTT